MKKNTVLLPLLAAALMVALLPRSVWAGATLTIGEDTKIDLGFRLQALFLSTDKDVDGSDNDFERFNDFKIRRARIRLGADITRWVSMFLQTDFANDPTAGGGDMRVIDAFVVVKPHPLAYLYMGENMAPASRENLTSSGALMTMDYPGVVYKSLTWGARAITTFANATYTDSDSGLRGDVSVRDNGATLFGSTSLTDMVHLKYYLGVYNGIQKAGKDNERFSGRVQVNLFDAEPGYFNLSTYLGKKKTVGVGASFDSQADVAKDVVTGKKIDYTFYSADLFADYPVGPGSVTFETGYEHLDLDDAVLAKGTGTFDARQSQGNGFYAQAGYYYRNWQPWAEYEMWNADAASEKGDYHLWRVGASYFIKGHNANVKAGYERFKADSDIDGTTEDTIDTFAVGLYVTY